MNRTYKDLVAHAYQLSTAELKELIDSGNDDKLVWFCFRLRKEGKKWQKEVLDFKPLFDRTYNK